MFWLILSIPILLALLTWGYVLALRQREMHRWLGSYYFPVDRPRQIDEAEEPVDVFISVCDHYEPQRGHAPKEVGIELVNRWVKEYPERFAGFHDISGRVPQHSFFFPQDEYQPEYLDALKILCEAGYGDVDVHLHHDKDTAEGLTHKLLEFKETLFHQHGLLRRDPITQEIVYGFIHGNWTLCNSHPEGLYCGVNEEIKVLRDTGCYADFTLPSAPSPTQTVTINSIYYAWDRPGRSRSHETGQRAAVGRKPPEESLLMIQGALLPDWQRAKFGIFPRIENSDLHATRPPTATRLDLWLQAGVQVQKRPEWKFIKLHTHGCKEGNIDMLLGEQMQQFHQHLADRHQQNPNFRYHYVTAWEMYQLVKQAEAGETVPKIGTSFALN